MQNHRNVSNSFNESYLNNFDQKLNKPILNVKFQITRSKLECFVNSNYIMKKKHRQNQFQNNQIRTISEYIKYKENNNINQKDYKQKKQNIEKQQGNIDQKVNIQNQHLNDIIRDATNKKEYILDGTNLNNKRLTVNSQIKQNNQQNLPIAYIKLKMSQINPKYGVFFQRGVKVNKICNLLHKNVYPVQQTINNMKVTIKRFKRCIVNIQQILHINIQIINQVTSVTIYIGLDNRTTIMIRNIPNKYTVNQLSQQIQCLFGQCYDFLYLPCDLKNQCNVGYGFINFKNTHFLKDFYLQFHGQKWNKFKSQKICNLTYARLQGLESLIQHFQNSKILAQKQKRYKPIIKKANDQLKDHKLKLDNLIKNQQSNYRKYQQKRQ